MKLKIVHHEDADGFFGAYVIHNHEKDTYDDDQDKAGNHHMISSIPELGSDEIQRP